MAVKIHICPIFRQRPFQYWYDKISRTITHKRSYQQAYSIRRSDFTLEIRLLDAVWICASVNSLNSFFSIILCSIFYFNICSLLSLSFWRSSMSTELIHRISTEKWGKPWSSSWEEEKLQTTTKKLERSICYNCSS